MDLVGGGADFRPLAFTLLAFAPCLNPSEKPVENPSANLGLGGLGGCGFGTFKYAPRIVNAAMMSPRTLPKRYLRMPNCLRRA